MSLPQEIDIAILGAGLAGLSITSWLDELAPADASLPRLLLLEAREEDTHDRTWCFWDQVAHPFKDAISHRWPSWQVGNAGEQVEYSDPNHPYAMLSADAMRRSAYSRIAKRNEFTLIRGIKVDAITPQSQSLRITTSQGHLNAKVVIDTRPPPLSALAQLQGVWQVFHGAVVYQPNHGYDLSKARLMDFQTGHNGIHFIYLLPLDENHLLVEWTCFDVDRHSEACKNLLTDKLPWMLASWLDEHLGKGWVVQRSEIGCLHDASHSPPPEFTLSVRRYSWRLDAPSYRLYVCQLSTGRCRYSQTASQSAHSQRLALDSATPAFTGDRMDGQGLFAGNSSTPERCVQLVLSVIRQHHGSSATALPGRPTQCW
nr:lycopene cyclase family protein [Salinivibrio socompensis]